MWQVNFILGAVNRVNKEDDRVPREPAFEILLLADLFRCFFLVVIQRVPLTGILVREAAVLQLTLRNSHPV